MLSRAGWWVTAGETGFLEANKKGDTSTSTLTMFRLHAEVTGDWAAATARVKRGRTASYGGEERERQWHGRRKGGGKEGKKDNIRRRSIAHAGPLVCHSDMSGTAHHL